MELRLLLESRCTAVKLLHLLSLLLYISAASSSSCTTLDTRFAPFYKELKIFVDQIAKGGQDYGIIPGISVKRYRDVETIGRSSESCHVTTSVKEYLKAKLYEYASGHYVSIDVPQTTARFFRPIEIGKSSFMAGFGMGFLAKLLLPVFIGAQLIKSVLIALFLPSIIGNLGKVLGKGLSTFSGASGSSGLGHGQQEHVEDFEFKDTNPYNDAEGAVPAHDPYGADTGIRLNVAVSTTEKPADTAASRFGYGNNRIYNTAAMSGLNSDNYYFRKPQSAKTDYKVFHKIPPSSLLLTSYDPFYSPLLSRLDVVFQQFGFKNDKSPATELCRERLVCMMYANPAKYAPYSNLVSAQLSRELNELRRPSSDNPEILRFFRYMKAAKDGQDGEECPLHGGCPSLMAHRPSPAMLSTYNDINKLVQARKFG